MDQNESPWEIPDDIRKEILADLARVSWSRYPQPQTYVAVKQRLAGVLNIDPDQFAITSGCDQAIQGVHFLAGGPERKALVFQPTYPMIAHAANMAGTQIHSVNLGPEYRIDPALFPGHKLIFIANPNNPTGSLTPENIIREALAQPAFVFVDEAYFDFSQQTLIQLLAEYPNLAIGRSFSKSMLAGIRLGILMGSAEAVQGFESIVTAPYHLSHLQLITAKHYAQLQPFLREMSGRIVQERIQLEMAMAALGLRIYPSSANFILFEVSEPGELFAHLLNRSIKLRDMRRMPGLNTHLRVTVGTSEQNRVFLNALEDFFSQRSE